MVYVLPQVQVFQDFALAANEEIRSLYALYMGGHATLYRYAQADEKIHILLGTYDHLGTNIDGEFKTCYDWPRKAVSAVVDQDYTKMFIDNALLRYWLDTSHLMTKTASNKIRHPSKNFKTNTGSYPRSADFLERDVTVGDTIRVTGSSDGGSTTFDLCTTVKAIEADQSAASVAATVADANNPALQASSSSATAGSSNTGTVVAPTVDLTDYDGLPDGDITETYTVTVTQASTGGDHTTARLRVTSGSGRDDDLTVTPSAATSPTPIGGRGLTLTFAAGDFDVGDTYTITVAQNFVPPAVNSGGTYVGTSDKTYIVEVTRGARFVAGMDEADLPQITVTTADGTDASGPHTVYPVGFDVDAEATTTTVDPGDLGEFDCVEISIGTLGVTVQIQGFGLRKGDKFVIQATAAADTNFRVLVLNNDLSASIPTDDAVTANLEVALYIKKNIQLGSKHEVVGGQYNFQQDDDQFCAMAGVQAYDSTWTDGGVQQPLDVITDDACSDSNQLYVEYRAWTIDLAAAVRTYDPANDDLDDLVDGPLTPDNPLKFALYMGSLNSPTQPMKFVSVADPTSLDSWQTALDLVEERDDVYNMVPLTHDQAVLEAVRDQVDAQSTPTMNRWRVLWLALADVPTADVVNETLNGEVVLCTTEDDPETAGTQYTLLKATPGSSHFADVRAGDVVRYQFTVDGWGDPTYTEYTVAEKINGDVLRLETGTVSAENTPIKTEVYRNLNATTRAQALADAATAWNNRRVRAIWPDKFDTDEYSDVDGMFLVSALAALASSVLPHQGLTNVEISGVSAVNRTTREFNRSQLDVMAGGGVWIVTQLADGTIVSRHAVTTADTETLKLREEQITRNLDSISYYFRDKFAPYIGIANNTPKMLEIIEAETLSGIQFLRSSGFTPLLGGQLIDATITELRASLEFPDRILLSLTVNLPPPLNGIDLHLLLP